MTHTDDQQRMTLVEHLGELRRRLIISFIAVAMGGVVCWILYPQILEFLLDPYCDSVPDERECQLYVQNPLEPFNVRLTIAGYGGLILAIPVVLWQVWRFIAPALYAHEKRYAIPFIVSGVGLFFLGAGLAYWSIPRALTFLSEVGGDDLVEIFSPNLYLSFVIKMIVAFGIGFEFPIVLVFLQILGILHNEQLRAARQYALVGIVVLVAVITPSGDPFTLLVLTVPMYLFYELAILFGRLRDRKQRRAAEAGS